MKYKLGSLFDGSGGFPLAGSLCGIEPVWAAEVEPYPIAVTRSRFPSMKHLGDISKINGAEIEPVDIVTFGSPCQDLSVAGKRAGLKHEANGDEETTRSGLFMEAVRIIKEMRRATNGNYPTFALWENVPGAFSSNKGEDFRIVLEELIKIVEPSATMPPVPKNGWPYADSYVGDGWSLAYRVFDAQYWGVPQRRRRIHLVLDLRGERAREVLFEREGVRGYFAEGRTPWKGAAAHAENCPGADDRAGVGVDLYNFAVSGDVAVTLNAGSGTAASHAGPSVCVPIFAIDHVITTGGNCTAQGPCVYEDIQATLKASGVHAVAYTLEPGIAAREGGHIYDGVCGTLRANAGDNQMAVAYSIENHPADSRVNIDESGTVQTLTSRMGTGGGNVPMVMEPVVFDGANVTSPVNASNPQPGDPCHTLSTDSRNYVVYCLQGNGIDRADTAGCNGKGWKEDTSYTLNTIDRPAVAYLASGKETVGTLMANAGTKLWLGNQEAFSGDYRIIEEREQPAVRYIVRRLTPTECARLQGFADRWGDIDEKEDFTEEEYRFWLDVRNTHATVIGGKEAKEYTEQQMLTWYNKLHTDSAEYKMWGNGIALPPALYVLQGMIDAFEKEAAE